MKKIMPVIFISLLAVRLPAQTAKLPLLKHKFIVIAHRGDHIEVPENTIASFENAIKHEADFVEIDLRTTRDSVLVIMHDATVDRMTGGKGKISDLTYDEIKRLNITDKTKPSSPTYQIPTFEEVLNICRNRIHIYLDFKNASVEQSYNMIRKNGMEHQVIVYINTPHQYTEWRSIAPLMPLMISLPDETKTEEALRNFLLRYPVELLDGDYSNYNAKMLKVAAQARITVWPDIQSPAENKNWDRAIELGFKGLQTDHPEALISYLTTKGLR